MRIYPRVNLHQISNSQCSVRFDKKRNDITIKGVIQRAGVLPGEETKLSLEIYNPIQLTIKNIDVCLIQRYEIEHCRRRLEVLRVSVPQLFDRNDEHIKTTCLFRIPKGIQPSFNYKSKHGRSGVNVKISYDIKLEVKVKGLFSDFELQVPITIGTDSGEYSNYANMTTNSTTSIDLKAIDILELQVDDDDIPSTS